MMAATPARWRSLFALIFVMCHLAVPASSFRVRGCKAAVVSYDYRSQAGANHRAHPTALLLAKKDNIDANDAVENGKQENDDLKSVLGAVFVALLAAEFILTPVLKPIILAARDQ
mmetsp:Transcript_31089/g.74137  ORF Transcript_31089/g.74137 Transcript_31089/m.74137 type:complete len:115 (+) Transcript_31089:85-429(+)